MTKTEEKSEPKIILPTGQTMSKNSIRKGLVDAVEEEFRKHRQDGYRQGNWVRYCAEKVVDRLTNIDAFFDAMLEAQKKPKGGGKKDEQSK